MNSSEIWNLNGLQYCFDTDNSSCIRIMRSKATSASMYIFMAGTIIFTITGNLVVIISVTHFRQLHTPTNFLILSLAVADCLVGLMVMPFSMIRSVETCWYFGNTFCKIHTSCDMMLCTCSILHLCVIAIDRYYAVCDPLHYVTKMTVQVTGVLLFIIWLVSVFLAFGLIFSEINAEGIKEFVKSVSCEGSCTLILNKVWGVVAPSIAFFIPAFATICIYIKIFIVAEKHMRVLSIQENVASSSILKVKNYKERKAAKTLGIVIGTFLLCWLPFFTTTITDPFLNFSATVTLSDAVLWLGYFNSMFNPLIYGLFYPWFRKALKMILRGALFGAGSTSAILFSD
ncbi:trace amine-associated receptor 4-like [Protopterus annectens]|uniref:trace amine-associated receptor 4-like n=1 Tax=Protopterus annectens TaxID=7888 RepID=UPI001CF9D67F|nr:trace amine-associated receptor 4-like [Protopterus annectens]